MRNTHDNTQAVYELEEETLEPDPAVVELNRDLASIEEHMQIFLAKPKIKCVHPLFT